MNIHRTLAVMRKEVRHIVRDRGTFILVTLSPVLLLFVLAYSYSVDIKNVGIAVFDVDQTPFSRQFVAGMTSKGNVEVRYAVTSYARLRELINRGQAKAGVVIPPGFARNIAAGRAVPLQVIVDGTDPNTANFVVAHIAGYALRQTRDKVRADMQHAGMTAIRLDPIDLRRRTWFNPSLRMLVGMMPALIAIVMGMAPVAATLAIAREKEWGTMEQLIATPIRRSELLVGKLLPYMVNGLLSVVLCVATAVAWFGIPFRGSFLLYLLLSLIFLFASMSLALLLSTFVSSQQAAQVLAILVFFFPGFFLSGVFFPLISMPPMAKMESLSVPTTHYVLISRGIILKGQGLTALWPYALGLAVMGVIILGFSMLLFRKRIA
jgi:ABC-2 type transport system permease protein